MESWFQVKVRGVLGMGLKDDKRIDILGRTVKWDEDGIRYEADTKHREKIMKYFGFNEGTKGSSVNGEKEDKIEDWEDQPLEPHEAKEFRSVVARMNYFGTDCPDLQFPVKQCSREMSSPNKGSWKMAKKIARYLVGRESITWLFKWTDGDNKSSVQTDSDWGGNVKDRKSTSGGVWNIGSHVIKTWSSSQGAFALSSATVST
jgi:hypothetical protein